MRIAGLNLSKKKLEFTCIGHLISKPHFCNSHFYFLLGIAGKLQLKIENETYISYPLMYHLQPLYITSQQKRNSTSGVFKDSVL